MSVDFEAAEKAWESATDAQRSAMYRDWEAQRPILALAVTKPPHLFVACWLAGFAAGSSPTGEDEWRWKVIDAPDGQKSIVAERSSPTGPTDDEIERAAKAIIERENRAEGERWDDFLPDALEIQEAREDARVALTAAYEGDSHDG